MSFSKPAYLQASSADENY